MIKSVLVLISCVFLIVPNTSYSQKSKKAHSVKEAKQYTKAELEQQVANTERAFAETMAKRDFNAFASFINPKAVFLGSESTFHGKEEVLQHWKVFYEKAEAPFSWKPEKVEILAPGTLAMSTGPVYDPKGKLIATFTSIWQLESSQTWRIIFDKGDDVCDKK